MIPNVNNITNFNNQIQIQLTTDNKCLIQALSESPIKSQNTIQKDDFSINDDMSLSKSNNSIDNNNINNNSPNASKPIILNSNKKNSNNDCDSNSNLLISFSNISEMTKINNNDNSLMRVNSNKNNSIIMNKEKDFVKNINSEIACDKNLTINNIANFEGNSIISNNNFLISNDQNKNIDNIKTPLRNINQNNNITNKNKNSNKKKVNSKKLLNQFNKNDLSEISCGMINLNLNNVDDKSENYDKVNFVYSDKKSDENSLKLNNNSNKNIIGNKNKNNKNDKNAFSNKKENIKCFKNCMVQKNEDINIIQIKTNKEKTIESHQDSIKKNQDKIIPNHCTNFSFCGMIKNNKNLKELDLNSFKDIERGQNITNLNIFQNNINNHTINNTNTLDINDDYVSPTFNLNLNYNSLDKNYNNSNTLEIESSKEKEIFPDTYAANKVNTNNNISIKNYNNLINNKDENNINIKKKNDKNKKEMMSRKVNNNNLKNQLIINKPSKLTNEQNKTYTIKTQEKNISITTNSNSNTKSIKDKENKDIDAKLPTKQKVISNNNFQNLNNILNNINFNLKEKNAIKNINNKNKQNSRYRHPNADSVHFNYDNILKNLNNSMTESDHKKKLSISSHTKSKSGTGSLIKFQGLHNNIFNIKNGTFIKAKNNNRKVKKFKSISPKIQRRNLNSGCLKLKYKNKSKSQNRSKTNSKSKNKAENNTHMNQIHLLMKNRKSTNCYNLNNIYTSKPLTIQERMDIILSKNIIALTKKLRKSPSPKMKVSRPSLIKNIIVNSQGKIVDNLRGNNFMSNNNINHNVSNNSKSKKKSPSPIHFKILSGNNGNYVYSLCNTNANQSSNNKKSIVYFNNNNINNYINDNLILVNNHDIMNKKNLGKKSGNSPKNIDENKNYLNQKKKLQIYDNININSNYQKVKNNKNTKLVNKKGLNLNKLEDDFKKRQYIQKNKNILMKDINKKNNNIIIINNIKINNSNNNNNKKNMTIIQNFSKYKKKAEVNNLVNMTTKNNKKNCYNENVSNNYLCLRKNVNDEKYYKKNNINLNINNIANRIIEDKKKKVVYNTSLHKKTEQDDDFYTS